MATVIFRAFFFGKVKKAQLQISTELCCLKLFETKKKEMSKKHIQQFVKSNRHSRLFYFAKSVNVYFVFNSVMSKRRKCGDMPVLLYKLLNMPF